VDLLGTGTGCGRRKERIAYDGEKNLANELNLRIDPEDDFPLVEAFDRRDLSSPTLPERH
jgi:hypothetical protein